MRTRDIPAGMRANQWATLHPDIRYSAQKWINCPDCSLSLAPTLRLLSNMGNSSLVWGQILGRNPVLRVFLLAIHSHLYSYALRFLFLQTHATSTLELLYTVKEKGGKTDRKSYTLPFGLRNPYRNIKSEKLQKPQLYCTFINSVSAVIRACTVPMEEPGEQCSVVFA